MSTLYRYGLYAELKVCSAVNNVTANKASTLTLQLLEILIFKLNKDDNMHKSKASKNGRINEYQHL